MSDIAFDLLREKLNDLTAFDGVWVVDENISFEEIRQIHPRNNLLAVTNRYDVYTQLLAHGLRAEISDFDFSNWPQIPSEDVFKELLVLRKKHKLSNSSLAFATIGTQMTISATNGYSVDQCIAQWVTSGWKTFKADYMNSQNQQSQNTTDDAARIAREKSFIKMGLDKSGKKIRG
jgi:hypothetical protein